MDDVWLGRDATRADIETCSEGLALSRSGATQPLFAIQGDDTLHLLLASRRLLQPFGVTTGDGLAARLLSRTDPGSRRLVEICRTMPVDGTPRLERLRFYLAPGTQIVTILCRRISYEKGVLFVASALGLPVDRNPPPDSGDGAVVPSDTRSAEERRSGHGDIARAPLNVQSIQSMLRARWPASRTPRFTWQTEADLVCTQVSAVLADVVGQANGLLVGRDMVEVATAIDPDGRLATALARRETWSGVEVGWPICDAPAAVTVGLGAIPIFSPENAFEGYRGYGILHLDRIVARTPMRLAPLAAADPRSPSPAPNVVRFPATDRTLSEDDRKTFVTLGTELRVEAGLDQDQDGEREIMPQPASRGERRVRDAARHGLAILDKLAAGILVARDNVPIFANRHLLDNLGFADEDALHDAGGLRLLFDGDSGGPAEHEAAGIRGRDGRIVPGRVRIQTLDWEGLPATLLTLLPVAPLPVSPGHAAASKADSAELGELRAILETATDGVAVIDADHNVVSLNRSGEALFGCDRDAVVGKPFLGLFAEDNQDLAADYLEGLRSNATKRLLNDGREFLVNAHRGGTIPVFMTLGRLSGSVASDDRPGGARFCALFRDLTHWKKVERDLEVAKQGAERANDLKSDFLAKVSHEVRTPLNAIIGFAEVMMDERFGPVGNERYKDYLRDIHASGSHVMSLVNDLLDLSKIEAGQMELAVEIIDVNKVINECVAIMQPQASGARVIMRLSLSPTLPRIKADERSLRQIALNVISNAVKFNEPGGQVIIATAMTEAGHVVIRFRDTGPGMSEEDVAAALEPFRQIATTSNAIGGTGLGLPLTKALVEANQATFAIRSKLQHGTLVEVAFPPARVLAT